MNSLQRKLKINESQLNASARMHLKNLIVKEQTSHIAPYFISMKTEK